MIPVKCIRIAGLVGLLGLAMFGIGLRLLNIDWLPTSLRWVAAVGVLIGVFAWGAGGVWGLSALSTQFSLSILKNILQMMSCRPNTLLVPSIFQEWARAKEVPEFAKLYLLPGPRTNAAVDARRNLWVTQDLANDCTTERTKGIINHEIMHLKMKHAERELACCTFTFFSALILGQFIFPGDAADPLILAASALAFLLTLSFVSWHHEYEADLGAVQAVEPQCYTRTLLSLRSESLWNQDSFTHPSLRERARALSDRRGPFEWRA
jgi:Zn-dependent protease with chaperone function